MWRALLGLQTDGVYITDVNDPGVRNIYYDELVENYVEATHGLIEGGSDIIL